MKLFTADLAYDCRADLGEGALWDKRISKLWWVDIARCRLHRFDPLTKINETFEIGSEVSAVVPEEGNDVVLAVKNGFASFDTKREKLEMLATIVYENPSVRFNDGKCDPAGRFWAGTLAEDGTTDGGDLYCLERDLSVTRKIKGVSISNGLGWSPKADKMYYIDSASQKVMEYDYDQESGSITSPRTVIEIEVSEGTPDGMCVDAEGMIWVALWNGGKVIRIHPQTGERLCEVVVPGAKKVTSCALGSKDLSILFITTASQGLTKAELGDQPNAGSLYAAHVGIIGIPANSFKRMST